jgi:hypothetical protein
VQNPWNGRKMVNVSFIRFLRKNIDLTLWKAENHSCGRLTGFNTEIVDDLFKTSIQTILFFKSFISNQNYSDSIS